MTTIEQDDNQNTRLTLILVGRTRTPQLSIPSRFGPQGQHFKNARQADRGQSATDPGPENRLSQQANPNSLIPPLSDHGEVKTFWNLFSATHRRIQKGVGARQAT
jgi:oxalate decarboxylase